MQVPNPPGSGKDIAEGKGVAGDCKSEGSRMSMDIGMMKYRRSIFQLSLGGYKNGGDNESNNEISGE